MSEVSAHYRDLSGRENRKTVDRRGVPKSSRTIFLQDIFSIFGEIADVRIMHSLVGDQAGIFLRNRQTGVEKRLVVLDEHGVAGYSGNKLPTGKRSGFVAKHHTKRRPMEDEVQDIFDTLSNDDNFRTLNFSTD